MTKEGFNPYSPGFSIYFDRIDQVSETDLSLQSLFTWIFYLFSNLVTLSIFMVMLQSLFTWIFYLFLYSIESKE